MLSMNPSSGNLVGSTSGREFQLCGVGVVFFGVSGLSGGSITIELQPYKDGPWETLDSTNLVFSADGFRYAVCGGGKVRATSSSATTGGTLFVGISGDYVQDPSVVEAP
jgi:hypothetical protein